MTGIAGALAGIHMGIAMMTKMPHWALEPDEVDAMAKSVTNVARHYPKIASSQKLIDWTMLLGTIGMAYVPRIMMTRDALADRKRGNPDNVNPMADAA